jgi:hypothetical protein
MDVRLSSSFLWKSSICAAISLEIALKEVRSSSASVLGGHLAIDQYSLRIEIFAGYSGSVLAPFTLNVPAIEGASVFG